MNTTHDKFRLASPAHLTTQMLRAHHPRAPTNDKASPPPRASCADARTLDRNPISARARRWRWRIRETSTRANSRRARRCRGELAARSRRARRARDGRRRRRRNGRRRRWRRGTRRRVNGAGSFLRFIRVDRDGTGANRRRAARRRRMRARRRTRARRRRSPSGRRRRRRLARAAVLITRGEGRDARVRG